MSALEITTSGVATPERERMAEFWPYFRSRNRAVVRAAQALQWASLADFLADTKPGTYMLGVTADETSAYDGTLNSACFTLAEGRNGSQHHHQDQYQCRQFFHHMDSFSSLSRCSQRIRI